MKLSEISSFKSKTARKIRDGYLHEALSDMRKASEEEMSWEITSDIDRIAESYSYMLRYLASGADDPGRQDIYDDLRAETLMTLDRLVRLASMREFPTLYYSVARTRALRPGDTVAALVGRFADEYRRLNADFESMAAPSRSRTLEGIQRDLFNAVWTTHPLSTADLEALSRVFDPLNDEFPAQLRGHMASGVTLGLLEFYDPRRLNMLLKVYMEGGDDATRMRALVGALCALYRYRSRPVPRDVQATMAAARDTGQWDEDLAAVAIELARATSTDRISDKLNKELIPAIMKIDPELQQKLRSGDFDPESLVEGINPEWEEKLRESNVARGLQEIQELQADGGDVFMGSFSHMKQFGFFNELPNWFLPFYDSHSTVADKELPDGSLGAILQKLPILCDSDKYSMVLAFDTVPPQQRATMLGAMGAQAEQMREALSQVDQASPLQKRRNIINKYVQNLYRFFKLFRRKNEFFPLFNLVPNLLELAPVAADYDNEQQLAIIAEFLFRHKFWTQAAYVLERLDRLAEPSATRAQQMGYAYEQGGVLDKAIARYEEAEMLDGDSAWTLRRLASVLRRSGQSHRAAGYYKRLSDMFPDDAGIALATGYALSEADEAAEAEQYFHKAVYLQPDSDKAARALAWTQFLNRKFDKADTAYARLMSTATDAEDILNAGHVKLAMGKAAEAVNLYRRYASTENSRDIEKAIVGDSRFLLKAGVDISQLRLLVEAVKYS